MLARIIVSALPAHWRARAAELERFAPAATQAFREAADQLQEALPSAEESVTLREAADIGGYSVDALQRMVAAGRIENAGRKGKPRIRLAQVPTKPGRRASLQNSKYRGSVQPTAVVASVIAREKSL
jgi:hypothetical protein